MIKECYDIEGQKKRAAEIRRLVIENHVPDINKDGSLNGTKWLIGGGDPKKGGISEYFYFCQNLWNESSSYGEITEKIYKNFSQLDGFGTFEPCFCSLELVRNKNALTKNQVKLFEDYAQKYMEFYMDESSGFIGVNDNTPCLMVAGLILGGEYFKNDEWEKEGIKRLYDLKAMLMRRGFLSEYNSLTYTPISLYGLAAVVNYAKSEESKEIALWCEEKVWADVAHLYQPSVSQTAGPYARAYSQDKLAKSYNMRTLLYVLLGGKCCVNPINTIFKEDKDENYYWQISAGHVANMLYHCPVETAEFMINKSFPYMVKGTAEISASADAHLCKAKGGGMLSKENIFRTDFEELYSQDEFCEYGAGVVNITSFIDDSYSIGTADRDWHNGVQCDCFNVLYSKGKCAKKQSEVGTIFANYTVNGSDFLGNDYGRKLAFQRERTSMVLYRPKWMGKEIRNAGLNLVFSNCSLINEIRVENETFFPEKITAENTFFKGKSLSPVFVSAAEIYVFLIPLVCEEDLADFELYLSSDGENLRLILYNYKGERRFYHKKGFQLLTNGFICEVRRKDEFESFDDFIQKFKEFTVNDKLSMNIHTRYAVERTVKYEGYDGFIEACISVFDGGVKYALANGELIESVKLSAGGI